MNQPRDRSGAGAAAGLSRRSRATDERETACPLGLGAPQHALKEVAEILALSPERIARLEQTALEKFRRSAGARRADVRPTQPTRAAR